MDSILSVTIRDTRHPCSPYKSTRHSFKVQVYNCDGTPLEWKGLFFGGPGVLLQHPGMEGGRIHGQFRVPPGAYLVRAIATCGNVITDWAWVDVCCGQRVCVDLVLPSIIHCIKRTEAGLRHGTMPRGEEEAPAGEVLPDAGDLANALADFAARVSKELPEATVTRLPDLPTEDEIGAEGVQTEEA